MTVKPSALWVFLQMKLKLRGDKENPIQNSGLIRNSCLLSD